MAFEDDFSSYIEKIKLHLQHINGEEATKQSLVIPLFHVLGYDVYNPLEVQPEYGADFKGPKKGQSAKVDYALKIDGKPVVFVECKAADIELDLHDNQLSYYFNSTPTVRVGILTNGIRMKVFTDLQQPNVMDDKPWMDFDIRTPKPAELDALKKFRKTEFAADQIVSLAEEMVYYNVLVPFMASQLLDPSEELVQLAAKKIPSLKYINKKVIDRLTPVLRKAIHSAILEHVARSFNSLGSPNQITLDTLPQKNNSISKTKAVVTLVKDAQSVLIATKPEELETYNLVSQFITENFPSTVVKYRGSKSCFTLRQQGSKAWLINLNFRNAPYWISFRNIQPEKVKELCKTFEVADGGQDGDSKVFINNTADVSTLKPIILEAFKTQMNAIDDTIVSTA
jgi:predicted type IV restriction endonuclease